VDEACVTTSVVVMVVTRGSIVLAGTVDPGIVVPDIVAKETVSITEVLTIKEFEISVDIVDPRKRV
jgi:hypothetical protein